MDGRPRASESLLTAIFLIILAIGWIAVILPAELRARRATPLIATRRFERDLRSLAAAAPSSVSAERRARASFSRLQRRRRRLFAWLLASAALSGLAGAAIGGATWQVHLAFDVSLLVYVSLLLQAKKRRGEQSHRELTPSGEPAPHSVPVWTPSRWSPPAARPARSSF